MTTTLSTIDSLLQRYKRFGIELGLASMERLLKGLQNPHHGVPVVHVAGTNGKGSVCAYVASVLTAAGYRVGRYTSPHLSDWTERVWINGQSVTAEVLYAALMAVEGAIATNRSETPAPDSPTLFEVVTAAAWWCFAQAQVDIVVLEVGLGGRLDATNVCVAPAVSVITSIGLDHCEFLGDTLADIAFEKAGILKPGCSAVVGPLLQEAHQVVAKQAQVLNCPVMWAQPAQLVKPPVVGQTWAQVLGVRYPLPLVGDIQLVNSGVAIATLQTLRNQGWIISDDAITTGMAHTTWPGRLQWTTWQGREILLDGAHNPAAARALRDYVDQLNVAAIHWVLGMLTTKDHRVILETLLRSGDSLSLVPVAGAKGANPDDLKQLAAEICPSLQACQTFPSLLTGLNELRYDAQPVLAGSLYLVGEFLRCHLT